MLGFWRKNRTTEQYVSQTITESVVSVSLGSKQYDVPCPTLATLVEISAISSMLSQSDGDPNLLTLMQDAKDAKLYADMLAAFILGVKKGNHKQRQTLSEEILYSAGVSDVINAIQSILSKSDIGGLFMLTTSLREMRLTRPTREVGSDQIALGQE